MCASVGTVTISVLWFWCGTGNAETLRDEPARLKIDVRSELLAFHAAFYSANLMTLAVVGRGVLFNHYLLSHKTRVSNHIGLSLCIVRRIARAVGKLGSRYVFPDFESEFSGAAINSSPIFT